jgi:SAM-dependent methyltransferase
VFDRGDLNALGEELSFNPKYGEVIRASQGLPKNSRVLEVGCSRGYLTSYFILGGYDVRGTEISQVARSAAISDFGPFFYHPSDVTAVDGGPFDFIYHIGVIGCVADPVGLTNSLVDLLKPGGRLVFNAPNVNACWYRGQLWVDYAVPPDVVTLYKPGVWKRILSKKAVVVERVGTLSQEQSLQIAIRRILRRWKPPIPQPLNKGLSMYKFGPSYSLSLSDKVIHRAQSWALMLFRRLHLLRVVPRKDAPFDIFIEMQKP